MKQSRKWLRQISLWEREGKTIAYVDEVGRGSIAGDLVSCCVSFKTNDFFDERIDDSKKVKEEVRYILADKIKQSPNVRYGYGIVGVKELNETKNIHLSVLLSFERAITNLSNFVLPDIVLIDGKFTPKIELVECIAVPNGDEKVFGIACASILAKAFRDKVMIELDRMYDHRYDWTYNKGYRSRKHFEGLKKYGISQYHRTFFKDVLSQTNNL